MRYSTRVRVEHLENHPHPATPAPTLVSFSKSDVARKSILTVHEAIPWHHEVQDSPMKWRTPCAHQSLVFGRAKVSTTTFLSFRSSNTCTTDSDRMSLRPTSQPMYFNRGGIGPRSRSRSCGRAIPQRKRSARSGAAGPMAARRSHCGRYDQCTKT